MANLLIVDDERSICEMLDIAFRKTGHRVETATSVAEARGRLRPQVRLETRRTDGPWRAALPPDTHVDGNVWHFTMPEGGVEPLLKALVEGNAGVEALAIERPGLHDAFVAIAGEAAAREMDAAPQQEAAA